MVKCFANLSTENLKTTEGLEIRICIASKMTSNRTTFSKLKTSQIEMFSVCFIIPSQCFIKNCLETQDATDILSYFLVFRVLDQDSGLRFLRPENGDKFWIFLFEKAIYLDPHDELQPPEIKHKT
jgi:hypothetical protein